MQRPQGRPRRAMVLAAGLGERMQPITRTTPKPLIAVGGTSMLDRILDALAEHGVEQAVVNAHHLADLIVAHLAERRSPPPIRLSRESTRLETGGGVRHALPMLGEAAFFVVNGDVLWQDGPQPALGRLAGAWDERLMDALLLLHPLPRALGYQGPGDFHLLQDGRLVRRTEGGSAPYLFAGLQILHPRLFAATPEGAFSLNLLYNQAIGSGRLYGIEHLGGWCHVGTPADIAIAEAFLRNGAVAT